MTWSHTFDNRKRHCWEMADGTRKVDVSFNKQYCHQDHTADPKVVGKVEWMRFIHEVQDLFHEGESPFSHVFGVTGGVEIYRPEAHASWHEVRLIFSQQRLTTVTIETDDESLVLPFDRALALVEDSYGQSLA
jgi:hypothetical protein